MLTSSQDYYNPGIAPCDNLDRPWEEKVERARHPREPWHDIQVGVKDGPAVDLASNFVQRWNHHVKEAAVVGLPLLAPVELVPPLRMDGVDPLAFWDQDAYNCKAQVCRSLSSWSGNHTVEHSIYNAYLTAIIEAEHFIYIENQFFISSVRHVQNRIAEALADRVRAAIDRKEIFRVIVVLPLHSEGQFTATPTRRLHWLTYKTIHFMKNRIEKGHPHVKVWSVCFLFDASLKFSASTTPTV